MSEAAAGIYTIGQTPRPDLTNGLSERLGPCRFEIRGALDEPDFGDLPPPCAGRYPLETRLRDGSRVIVDADFVAPRIQSAIAELDDLVGAHLVLCAGPFPGLRARRPLLRPFDVAVSEVSRRGFTKLEVIVPFAAQAEPAAQKWQAAGLQCRTHALGRGGEDLPLAGWISRRTVGSSADAIVLDYVGLPAVVFEGLRAEIELPMLDVGRLALDELARVMQCR